jgi:hypothetical protein
MKFDDETRARLPFKVDSELDLTSATVELKVDGTWYAAGWEGAATKTGNRWTRPARTSEHFAGPNVTASGAVVLTLGRHLTQVRVTSGGDQIVAASTPIDVA